MRLKNKTGMFQKVNGKPVRPWRYINVPDGTEYDKNKFEKVGGEASKGSEQKINKHKGDI